MSMGKTDFDPYSLSLGRRCGITGFQLMAALTVVFSTRSGHFERCSVLVLRIPLEEHTATRAFAFAIGVCFNNILSSL